MSRRAGLRQPPQRFRQTTRCVCGSRQGELAKLRDTAASALPPMRTNIALNPGLASYGQRPVFCRLSHGEPSDRESDQSLVVPRSSYDACSYRALSLPSAEPRQLPLRGALGNPLRTRAWVLMNVSQRPLMLAMSGQMSGSTRGGRARFACDGSGDSTCRSAGPAGQRHGRDSQFEQARPTSLAM